MKGEKEVILKVALPNRLRQLFDYLPPQGVDCTHLKPGIRVSIPLQSRSLVGLLIDIEKKSTVPYEKLKRVHEILDVEPILPADIYQLCLWAARYYQAPLGEVLFSALPTFLRKGKSFDLSPRIPSVTALCEQPLTLNAAQQQAVETISASLSQFKVFLLDGVTGSGKTEVYLQTMATVLAKGLQVLVLVPEISLTPQTIERFKRRFNFPILALHSNLTERQRLEGWVLARNHHVNIVIGTRSAIFTPFQHLGLIIVDEEHDTSFKQQDRFRYHARDLAVLRAQMNHLPIILGSATPSLETLFNVNRGRYTALSLPERAGGAKLPRYELIDLRKTSQENGLSAPLLSMIEKELNNHNQVLLFLNRRGFAPVLYCVECGFIAECKRCDARLVYHRSPKRLHCHRCDTVHLIPEVCQQCQERALEPVGLGTQRLEQMLGKHFPHIPLIRVDRDSTRKKGQMQELLAQISQEPKAILIGTQMLAKGHHFANVTLVGVIDADAGLFSADFRAAEQMGQLLLQVAGRAGRADKPGVVVIQTRNPTHPLLTTLIHHGYPDFSNHLLEERKNYSLPPFNYCALLRAEAYKEEQAQHFLLNIKKLISKMPHKVDIFGPVSALIAKRKGLYSQQIIFKTTYRKELQHFLSYLMEQLEQVTSPVKWILDVDPIEI